MSAAKPPSVAVVSFADHSFSLHALDNHLGDGLSEGGNSRRSYWRLVSVSDGPESKGILDEPGEAARVFAALFTKKFFEVSGNPYREMFPGSASSHAL